MIIIVVFNASVVEHEFGLRFQLRGSTSGSILNFAVFVYPSEMFLAARLSTAHLANEMAS